MTEQLILKEYDRWLEQTKENDEELYQELLSIQGNYSLIEDAFYQELKFGTGGLRGILGAGTNRMNQYTVAKATQGLANYLLERVKDRQAKVAISFDSRKDSEHFAHIAARVFAANGIEAHLFNRLMPTPCLSYAVRKIGCDAGVMITASHNPREYNGYKVYGADGCQVTTQAVKEILEEIERCDIFSSVKWISFAEGISGKNIKYVTEQVVETYISEVKKQQLSEKDIILDRSISIVYTPLNGTGREPVLRALEESGFERVTVVCEQEYPDQNFTTCPYPNPEIRETLGFAISYAKKSAADIVLATDPDCDRVGIAVRNGEEYTLLTGNETGILLADYICMKKKEKGLLQSDAVIVKTIVTTDMIENIAKEYGVRVKNVLTGFKYIGEYIGELEKEGKEENFLFGLEESYGYLSGSYVRDKDAVVTALLICEMCAYYLQKGYTLLERLNQIYDNYGYCLNSLHTFDFPGKAGKEKMETFMEKMRKTEKEYMGYTILEKKDYLEGMDGLPKENVLVFRLKENISIVVRPSGTEPKMKMYFTFTGESQEKLQEKEKKLFERINLLFCP